MFKFFGTGIISSWLDKVSASSNYNIVANIINLLGIFEGYVNTH